MIIVDEIVTLDSVYTTCDSKTAGDVRIAVVMKDGGPAEPICMSRKEARELARLILEALEKD